MSLYREAKNKLFKSLSGLEFIPSGLIELHKYFKQYGPITFKFTLEEGVIVATSTNFRFGAIITYGKNERELDGEIRDAILTAFEVPSAYRKEAAIVREGEHKHAYGLA